MSHSFSDKLGFWHFDDNLMIFKDGSIGGGFKLGGFDISCAEPSAINQLCRNLENMLISADEGLRFQVFYRLMPNVSDLVEKHRELSKNIEGPYQRIVQARLNYFKENEAQKNYFVPAIYLFVRSQAQPRKKQGLFSSPTEYETLSKNEFLERRTKFLRSFRQIKSSLTGAGLSPNELSAKSWFRLIFEYLNLERAERIGTPYYREPKSFLDPSVGEQLTLTDLFWNKEGVGLGKYKFRSISLATLPEGETYASMVNAFASIPFHFWISQSIHILDQSKEKSGLELKRRVAHSMASGSENVSDLDAENKLGQIEGLLSNLMEGSEKLLSSDFTVTIWGDSKSELDDKTDEILKTFRSMNQAEGIAETLASKDAFLKSVPGLCDGLRIHKMKSSNISHLMPVFAGWRGNPRPVCLIPKRDGDLFSLDPYADELPAWNGIVFGSTGAGKSYTVVQLMAMFFGKVRKTMSGKSSRPRIVWIDNGASSKRLVEVLDGEFIDLNLNANIRINMFDLKEGETKPSADRIRTVLAVLEMILKDEDRKALGKREKALLEEQVHKVYENAVGKIPTLSDLKKLLDQHSDKRMNEFGEILYSWTGKSAYGKILDGKSNVKLSKDLISIEVQQLTNYSDLKDVLLLLLTSYIQDVASSDIEREYLLIIDEAERLFQSELAKQVVITCYRTWRKFKSGIWCLSQNYKDFMADESLKDALMTNTTSVIILRQRKIDWNHFKETFDFNDTQVERIKSLKIVKGEYGEFYYLQDENEAILRLIPEPLSHWISTSDANDKVTIKELEQEMPEASKLDILETLAFQEKPA